MPLLRLERENDMLARQLLTSKITMRADLDKLEDLKESLEKVIFVVGGGGGVACGKLQTKVRIIKWNKCYGYC